MEAIALCPHGERILHIKQEQSLQRQSVDFPISFKNIFYCGLCLSVCHICEGTLGGQERARVIDGCELIDLDALEEQLAFLMLSHLSTHLFYSFSFFEISFSLF